MKPKSVLIPSVAVLAVVLLSFVMLPNQQPAKQVFNGILEDLLRNLKTASEMQPEDRLYLHLDKPFYKPGEDIWFTAYIRDGETMKKSSKSDIVYVDLINPKGSVEKTLSLIAENGMAKGDFHIEDYAAGGLYKLKARTTWQGNENQPAHFGKEIQVQKVVLPRLKMKLDFMKKAYGAGDEVAAELSLQDNTNKPLANYNFRYVVNLNGAQIHKGNNTTGNKGEAMVKFNLPEELTTNDGLLNVMINYQGQTESISRSVPIVLNNIKLGLYPEGGDLVAGLSGRVAFKAINEFGKPADIEGVVVNNEGKEVTTFSSYHQGMGAFDLTPKSDETYTIKITKPIGVSQTFEVPEVMKRGYGLKVRRVTKDQIYLTINSTEEEELNIITVIRGKSYFATKVAAKKGENSFNIPVKDMPMGVAQITLFDSKGIERAERLAMVNRDKQLNIEVSTDKEKYQPREKVNMTVKITDERGMPMPGNVSLSVVDDQLLTFADDKSSNILSWLLMEADIKEKVEEPNFYFDKDEEKAELALDYLLMTSGWRRFTWEQIRKQTVPSIVMQGERAILQGKVMDGNRNNRPFAKAKVQVGDKVTYTDENGYYEIEGYLYEGPTVLNISAKGYETRGVGIYGYSRSYNAILYRKVPKVLEKVDRLAKRAMPNRPTAANIPVPVEDDMILDVDMVDIEEEVEPVPEMMPEPEPEVFNNIPKNAVPPPPPVVEEVADEKVEEDLDDIMAGEELFEAEKKALKDVRMDKKKMKENFDMPAKKPIAPQNTAYFRAREFAMPLYEENVMPEVRSDFRSTVYWNGNLELNTKGKATISFYNSDAVTSFKVTAEGISDDGLVGRTEYKYFTQMPFSLSAKMPVEVVTHDVVKIPLTLVNNTNRTLSGDLELTIPKGIQPIGKLPTTVSLNAGQAMTKYLEFNVIEKSEADQFAVRFKSKGFNDAISQDLTIIPKGFPVELSYSGDAMDKSYKVSIEGAVENSMEAFLTAYPSSVSEILSGLEGMLRQPYGCFEQTSSSTYPNILVLKYLQETNQANPQVTTKAKSLIAMGYNRLAGFESPSGGFEWFGGDPGHEGLTAYGLMEFIDMQKVYDGVSQEMIARTTDWLLSKRDGTGQFARNPRALHYFGLTDQSTMSIYITWALTEAAIDGLQKEIDFAYKTAMDTKNPYQLGLAANILFNTGDNKRGKEVLEHLMSIQLENGAWEAGEKFRTAPGSGGVSLRVETAALAAKAMMKSGTAHILSLKKCVNFIKSQRSGYGNFGSTNATVLALRALIDYAVFTKRTDEPGTIEIYVNKKKVLEQSYEKGVEEAIVVNGIEEYLKDGDQAITVKYSGTSQPLPYSIAVNYSKFIPNSAKECVVNLSTKLASKNIKVGETVRLTTELTNTTAEGQPMTMAIVGLPAGLSPQPWQLKELLEKKQVDFYEVIGNNVVFYYRQMAPSEEKTIHLDLKADIAGTYQAPASSAYLYYTDEHKHWTALDKVVITP